MNIPGFLVPEQTVTANGEGAALELPADGSGVLELTLGILDVIEQESLDVNIHASADGAAWTAKPIAAFPQKFYKGASKILVDLDKHGSPRYIRAQWKVNRWGCHASGPVFRFYVFAAPA
ncbi:MAG TPA: hypothetical protein VFL57_12735 [Bryobacteraceae bacterium]|nr:hypothetical protein [Bryobacteraceae bacterium]